MIRLTILLTLALAGGQTHADHHQDSTHDKSTRPTPGFEEGYEAATGKLTGAGKVAEAKMAPTQGNDVRGYVIFRTAPGLEGVRVTATLTGLDTGNHGFHIHEKGDCSAPDASSAGGHFAPASSSHGAPGEPRTEKHMGDLGNIEAGPSGRASYDRIYEFLDFEQILGKAVIVHAGADDFVSQPSGDAGPRVSCGVITVAGQ